MSGTFFLVQFYIFLLKFLCFVYLQAYILHQLTLTLTFCEIPVLLSLFMHTV